MTPPRDSWAKNAVTRRVMQGNRGRDTRPELQLRRAAHALGLRYRTSTRPLAGVRRTADLVFPRARVAVFVDGCFWHGCPTHYIASKTNAGFWSTKIKENIIRDQETNELLIAAGWQPLRFWEHEDPIAAARRIFEIVQARRQAGGS